MIAASLLLSAALAQAAPAASASPAAEPTPRPLPNGPVVVLETSLGAIKIGLHKDKAPISVENFLRYVRVSFYNNTIFHRVMPGFMIQGGGYDANMVEKPARAPIRNEASNGLRNSRGSVAMARTNAPDSATAQFFINLKDNHPLDFGIRGAGYAVFGEVIEGMDVVDKIAAVPTSSKGPHENVPVTPVVIKSVRELAPAPAPLAKPEPKPQASPSSNSR